MVDLLEDLSPVYWRKLGESAAEAGVAIRNALLDKGGADLGAADQSAPMASFDVVKAGMDRAAMIGSMSIRVNPEVKADDGFGHARIFADYYFRLAEYGAKLGIDILIENHRPHFDELDQLLDLRERVDHPRFAPLADCGNLVARSDAARVAAWRA